MRLSSAILHFAAMLLLLVINETDGATIGIHAHRRSTNEEEQCCESFTCTDSNYPFCRTFSYQETPDVTSCSCASFCCLFRGCGMFPCQEDSIFHCHCVVPPPPHESHH